MSAPGQPSCGRRNDILLRTSKSQFSGYVLGSIPSTQELNAQNVKEIAVKYEYQQTYMDTLMHTTLFTSKMWP